MQTHSKTDSDGAQNGFTPSPKRIQSLPKTDSPISKRIHPLPKTDSGISKRIHTVPKTDSPPENGFSYIQNGFAMLSKRIRDAFKTDTSYTRGEAGMVGIRFESDRIRFD